MIPMSMQGQLLDDVTHALGTNHPARPYLLAGTVLGALSLIRHSFSGIVLLAVGATLVGRGMEEVRRVRDLHDGNHHGVNGPPANV
jgi:Na+/H+-translocating membrane pyrophosphatase